MNQQNGRRKTHLFQLTALLLSKPGITNVFVQGGIAEISPEAVAAESLTTPVVSLPFSWLSSSDFSFDFW